MFPPSQGLKHLPAQLQTLKVPASFLATAATVSMQEFLNSAASTFILIRPSGGGNPAWGLDRPLSLVLHIWHSRFQACNEALKKKKESRTREEAKECVTGPGSTNQINPTTTSAAWAGLGWSTWAYYTIERARPASDESISPLSSSPSVATKAEKGGEAI